MSIISIQPLGFQWQTYDPFLFCAYHHDHYPRGNGKSGPAVSLAGRHIGMDFEIRDGFRMYHGDKVPGFPAHPHRGFETITIVQQGLVDHADSLGAAGRYGQGDVQWLTAGRGIQHSEMFPLVHSDAPNPLLLFQLWLNLPGKSKMAPPNFLMFWGRELPRAYETDAAGREIRVEITAGDYGGTRALAPPPHSWAADPANHVAVWVIDLAAEAEWQLPAAASGLNRALYFFEGSEAQFDNMTVKAMHSLRLRSDQPLTIRNGGKPARLLLLQGKPINEPVAQHGPFVMNTRDELLQAFTDYQRDHFGGWPWPRADQVHEGRDRFASMADGSETHPES
ncbi:MAG TPA: pirin family protein [Candidatus Acidoferrum sp.]|nr:pirin family protein [Candidatus Acidoferrum sp.]